MFARLLAVMLAGAAAGAQEKEPGRGLNLYSLEKERALGVALAEEIRGGSTAVDSAAARDYIGRVGRQLAEQFPESRFPYTFELIDGSTNQLCEPITLPGGYIFVTSGLFLAARDEAEFAGMLAHAMAHTAARHGTRQATRGQVANFATVPLVYLGGWGGMGASGAAVPLGFLKLARAFELEADQFAVPALARAGYDPAGLLRHIERLQVEPAGRPKAFSPLPPLETRLAALREIIGASPARTYSSSEEYQRVREEVRRLTELRRQRTGPPSLRKPAPAR